MSSRLSPIRWFSDWRTNRYYTRTLSDPSLASRWAANYLDGLALRPGDAVLDHGCGRGRHLAFLQHLGFAVAGQDVSAHDWWRRMPYAALQAVSPDAPRLPWADGVFACVLDVGVIHYVPDAQLARLASEVFRVLRPGGYWLLIEANDRGYGAFCPRRLIGSLHPLARVERVVHDAGFQTLDLGFEGFYAPVLPRFVNFIRKQLRPGPFDVSDFDSSIAAAIPPDRRAAWRLRLQRA